MVKQFSFRTIYAVVALSLAIAVGVPSKLLAQGGAQKIVANSGTQFLLTFEQNLDPNLTGTLDDGYLEIWIASPYSDATVTVTTNNYEDLQQIIQVPKGTSNVYRLTTDTPIGTTDSLSDLWINSTEVPDDRVLQVSSTVPIVCGGMDYKTKSADDFLAIPLSASGTDYRVLAYQNCPGLSTPSEFAVAAFTDSTHITITPTATTANGGNPGTPINITLRRGQCVQIQTDGVTGGDDLTGSIVHADQPIAVYGGQAKTDLPAGSGTRDMLLEALPPVNTWGKVFALSTFDVDAVDNGGNEQTQGEFVRVLAATAGTTLTINGTPWTTLDANAYADTLILGPTLVEASQPVLVGEYGTTQGAAGTGEGNGDPFLAVVPAVDQAYNDCMFFASTDSDNFLVQKVVIMADVAAESGIVVDNGTPIPASSFTAVPGTSNGHSYAVTQLSLTPGMHTLHSNPEHGGFTAIVYSFGVALGAGYGILPSQLPPLGVNTQASDNLACSLQAYPNPVHGTLTVLTKTPATMNSKLYLYNALGELLRSFTVRPGDEERSLKVSDLSSGMYFLRLCPASGDVITRQVIVEP